MSNQSSNIVLTGGGTGGHIYPCLAVAEAIREENPEAKLYYIGNDNKLEAELLTKDKLKDSQNQLFSSYIKFLGIRSYPLVNKVNPLSFFLWLYRFYRARRQAIKHLRENHINIVFGTGGYVAAPVFAAAIALKIPYIIHNLDAHIGLANRMFIADAYALTSAFDHSAVKPKNGQMIVTGNPISKKFLEQSEWIATSLTQPAASAAWLFVPRNDDGSGSINLLITGGSQGAEAINNAIGKILPKLIKIPQINIVHITGTKPYETYIAKYLNGNINLYSNYKILAYTHEMPELCAWADLTVCRSGAMTIAEMSASGVVPIFVPLPWAAHDHQTLNARALVDAGAAISLNQNEENFEEQLFFTIQKFVDDRKLLSEFRTNLQAFGKNDAARIIANLITTNLQGHISRFFIGKKG